MGRLLALSIVAGSVYIQTLAALPSFFELLLAMGGICGCLILISRVLLWAERSDQSFTTSMLRTLRNILLLILFMTVSCAWSTKRAEWRLQDRLDASHENVVTKLSFLITGLVQDQGDSFRFEAQVLDEDQTHSERPGIPRHIQVVWRKSNDDRGLPEIIPGQIWRAALIFRKPRSALNPHGFDYEAHLLSRNIRAIGRVRGVPVLVRDEPFASMQVIVSRGRQYLRSAMRKHVVDMTYGAVLIALAIGDQDSVSPEHWEVFNKTGITHLVSISGSHVTMLAAFGGFSMLWAWKRLRWGGRSLAEKVPAKIMAALTALLVAWMYCLLAGWGVPARRTFFMLLVSGLALLSRLPIRASSVLCIAAAIVTMIDPWSGVSTGFWLSFGAVAVLFYLGSQTQNLTNETYSWHQRCWRMFKESARLQWLITLSMLTALAYLFQQVSISSPLANAIAIPVVTFIVTPLALLMGVVALMPGLDVVAQGIAWGAHFALDWSMMPVGWLAYAPWSSLSVSAMPIWCLVISLAGIAWALQPPGVPLRWVGWSLLLPALTWQPQRPAPGSWRMIAMDVGQGGGVLVQTSRHMLIFDVGPRMGVSDAGQRVVNPLLRALGVKHIDALVVSHSDIDHAGGLPGLLKETPVSISYSSFNLEQWIKLQRIKLKQNHSGPMPLKMLNCVVGQKWIWDDVTFSMLHPEKEAVAKDSADQASGYKEKKVRSNAQSCVLHVKGRYHSVLLPGDISIKQENEILQRTASEDLRADVVVVAHHGSLTSSSQNFISLIRAQHAIAQTGYFNRFSHPAGEIERRWRASHVQFWRTDQHGAVIAESDDKELRLYSEAVSHKKYWHEREFSLENPP